jgi:tetrahydromethanopterin S-methyltransferase subunit G
MQALSDEQQINRVEGRVDRLEKKVDGGFAETRREIAGARNDARSDFRTLLGVQLTTLVAMILGFAGLILQHVWS